MTASSILKCVNVSISQRSVLSSLFGIYDVRKLPLRRGREVIHAIRGCIQLTSQAVEALKRHRQGQVDERQKAGSAWVRQNLTFCSPQGKPLDAANLLSRSFRPLLTKAGLDRIRFHDLRHTTATLLLTMGTHPKVVQELLGHSRISMTLDLYSHVIPSLQEETMQRFSTYLTSQ